MKGAANPQLLILKPQKKKFTIQVYLMDKQDHELG
jgi:hypothetical protein